MAKKNTKKQPVGRFAPWILRVMTLLFIWSGIALCGLLLFFAIDLPSIDKPKDLGRRPSLTILAQDGSVLIRTGQIQGHFYKLKELPKYVPEAVLAIEDRRFYYHFGIDPIGIARAVFTNLIHRDVMQGGSTITQQLAKNMFLSPEQKLKRKVQEAMLAIGLEMKYSKAEILEAYLNRVYMGSGTYGIDGAARRYFNKSAKDLSLREAAMIAGLLRSPNYFSPAASPARASDRANIVLHAMQDVGYITDKQMRAAETTPPPPGRRPGSGDGIYYAADYVAAEVARVTGEINQDLTVQTTLDSRMQRAAEQAVDEIIPQAEEKNVSQAALVAVAPDGSVRALIGGANYHDSSYNRAYQAKRQPGSAFKPIIYLAGLEAGLTPATEIEDAEISFGSWRPQNFDGEYLGQVTLAYALAKSLNSVAIRVLDYAGVTRTVDLAQRLGIQSKMGANLSLALGTSEVAPVELATAYNTIAQLGNYHDTYVVQSITDSKNKKLYQFVPFEGKQVVAPDKVAALTMMMTGTINFGTGMGANIGRPQAGKTGTSNDYRDAWFAGFVPQLTAVVWMGNDDNSKMSKVTGGSYPARLWANFMQRAMGGEPAYALAASGVSYNNEPNAKTFDTEIIQWNSSSAAVPPPAAEENKIQRQDGVGGFGEIIQENAGAVQ
jgi:penicillin-binding protein 1A